MLEKAVPKEYHSYLDNLDGDKYEELMTRVAKERPDAYADTVKGLSDVANDMMSYHGGTASVKLDDLRLPPEVQGLKAQLRSKVRQIRNSDMSDSDKSKAVIDYLTSMVDSVPGSVMEAALRRNNSLAMQAHSGARGSKGSLASLLFGDLLLSDAMGKPVPVPALRSYGEGLSPLEYWASSSGARKGTIDLQFATANSGYLGRQLNNIGHRLIVTEDDCGTDRGLEVPADDADNIGSVLARNHAGVKAGTIIDGNNLSKLGGASVFVRSPVTCQAREGVCARCAGQRERGGFPRIGDQVGAIAARALAEPVTQAALSVKHSGGKAGGDTRKIKGFDELNQFLQVPDVFIDKATLASKDGTVEGLEDVPGGAGRNVIIGGEKHFVPSDRQLKVKQGDVVLAGDSLTDGVPNPAELTGLKGIGEGRKYFVDQYMRMLKMNKAGLHRRNVEALARAFINRVEVTDPEGVHGYLPGDVAPYDSVVRDYEPRQGSVDVSPALARGKYLEGHYSHHTIGTRVTPKVARDLEAAGVTSVKAHADEPRFKPVVVKARDFLQTDPDWLVRMSGENLKKSIISSATEGASSDPAGTSYIPAVANATKLDLFTRK